MGWRNALLIATMAGATVALSACGTTSPRGADILPVQASVINRTGKLISRIEYRPCGDTGAWAPLGVSAIPSGMSAAFQLPAACVDMNAYFDDGKVAGSQRGIRRDFPFTWTLS